MRRRWAPSWRQLDAAAGVAGAVVAPPLPPLLHAEASRAITAIPTRMRPDLMLPILIAFLLLCPAPNGWVVRSGIPP